MAFKVIALVAATIAVLVIRIDALRCSCNHNPTCPPRPECEEYGRELCRCCDVCKLGFGEVCTKSKAPCKSGLKCLTESGDIYEGRPRWWEYSVQGVCVPLPTTCDQSS